MPRTANTCAAWQKILPVFAARPCRHVQSSSRWQAPPSADFTGFTNASTGGYCGHCLSTPRYVHWRCRATGAGVLLFLSLWIEELKRSDGDPRSTSAALCHVPPAVCWIVRRRAPTVAYVRAYCGVRSCSQPKWQTSFKQPFAALPKHKSACCRVHDFGSYGPLWVVFCQPSSPPRTCDTGKTCASPSILILHASPASLQNLNQTRSHGSWKQILTGRSNPRQSPQRTGL